MEEFIGFARLDVLLGVAAKRYRKLKLANVVYGTEMDAEVFTSLRVSKKPISGVTTPARANMIEVFVIKSEAYSHIPFGENLVEVFRVRYDLNIARGPSDKIARAGVLPVI